MAEILRVANSALFGLRREIATVEHAVATLGLSRVKSIATLIALNGMVKPALKVESLRRVWTQSLATALLSLARAANSCVDVAYTAGMLHNLGSLGLMSAYPEE
jgi:HD-like signal output (HDOD) protein